MAISSFHMTGFCLDLSNHRWAEVVKHLFPETHSDGIMVYKFDFALRPGSCLRQLTPPCSFISSTPLTASPSHAFFTSLLTSVTAEDGEGCLIHLVRLYGL